MQLFQNRDLFIIDEKVSV